MEVLHASATTPTTQFSKSPRAATKPIFEVINKMSNENQNLNKTAEAIPNTEEQELPNAPSAELTIVPSATDENADAPIVEAGNELAEMQPVSMQPAIDLNEAKRGLEAVLLAASEPMPLQELKKIFEGELNVDILRNLLDELRAEWAGRSVELAIVASGYRFRVKPDYQKYIDRLANEKPPKYSRAVLETMAIIAYRQPVTRSDIEDIRGVAVSPHILKTLEDRGWIDEIGHKDAPGRPALFATTKHFLDDLNLVSLDELPALHELQATLDMSQAGAALHAGADTLALPGVAASEGTEDAAQGNEERDATNIKDANEADTNDTDTNDADKNDADTANQNATEESAGHPHENHSQEPGASS
jgi:segregation and condensation protein B